MALATRPLVAGFLAGVFFALLWPLVLSPRQLPALQILRSEKQDRVSTTPEALLPTHLAGMLRNSLHIARQAVRGARYKSTQLAPLSATQPQQTFLSTSPSTALSTNAFSTSTADMASQKSFLQAVKDRRTYYQLNKEAPISDQQIVDIAREAVLHVPSSFNSQSARLVVLLNKEHDTFWDFVLEVLKPVVPEDQFPTTEKKVSGFRAAYGTILFFEDPDPVRALEKAFPIYAHHFPDWSEHTSAMHQFALWVALEAEGFGANLQHYNPIIDRKAMEHWKVPLDWKLRAQLVFGGRAGEPGPKDYKPLEDRLFVHGASS